MLREPLDQSVRFLAKCSRLCRGKTLLDEQITIFIVEIALLLGQHHKPTFPHLSESFLLF
jgi:hypothetical protein